MQTEDTDIHKARPLGVESRTITLGSNFSWMFLGNVIYAACQWGMVIVLAKMGSPQLVGQFSLGFAIAAPVIEFSNLRLRQILATDAKGDYKFGEYVALRFATVCGAFFVILAIAIAIDNDWQTKAVILIIGCAKAFEALSDIFYGGLQSKERMDRIAKSLIIKGTVSLVALWLGVYLTHNLIWGVLGLAGTWAVLLCAYDIPNCRAIVYGRKQSSTVIVDREPLPLSWNMQRLGRMAWLALPLGFSTLLMSLNTNIPRYFVENTLGQVELGVFVALSYFHRAGITVVDALGESASPRLSRYYTRDDSKNFQNLFLKLLGIGIILGISGVVVAVLIGKQLLTFFYGIQYARQDVFIAIMIASGIAYVTTFMTYGLIVTRRLLVQTALYAFSTISLVIGCWLLIPRMGIYGAALAVVIARLIHFISCGAVLGYLFWTSERKRKVQSQ